MRGLDLWEAKPVYTLEDKGSVQQSNVSDILKI